MKLLTTQLFAEKYPPIAITSHDSYGNLGITFNGGKTYTYEDINPEDYQVLKTLLKYKNYKAAQKLLASWGEVARRQKEKKQEEILRQKDEQEMLQELYDRGILK